MPAPPAAARRGRSWRAPAVWPLAAVPPPRPAGKAPLSSLITVEAMAFTREHNWTCRYHRVCTICNDWLYCVSGLSAGDACASACLGGWRTTPRAAAAVVSPGACTVPAAPLPTPARVCSPQSEAQQLAAWPKRLRVVQEYLSWAALRGSGQQAEGLHTPCSAAARPGHNTVDSSRRFSSVTTWQPGKRPGSDRLHLQRQLSIQQAAPQPAGWGGGVRLLRCGHLRTCERPWSYNDTLIPQRPPGMCPVTSPGLLFQLPVRAHISCRMQRHLSMCWLKNTGCMYKSLIANVPVVCRGCTSHHL